MAETNSLANLQSLIQTFTGKSATQKTSGTTSTTSTSLTEADITKLVQSALESNSGLASVAGGQAGAGMYNSTVNTQLTNDLVSRIAAQYAANSATKTTTTSGGVVTTKSPGLGGTGLLGLLGTSLLKGQIDPYLNGKKKLADLITGLGSGNAASTPGVNVDAIPPIVEQGNTADVNISSLLTDSLSAVQNVDFSSGFVDSIGSGVGVDAGVDFIDAIGSGIGVSAPDVELDFDSLEWDW